MTTIWLYICWFVIDILPGKILFPVLLLVAAVVVGDIFLNHTTFRTHQGKHRLVIADRFIETATLNLFILSDAINNPKLVNEVVAGQKQRFRQMQVDSRYLSRLGVLAETLDNAPPAHMRQSPTRVVVELLGANDPLVTSTEPMLPNIKSGVANPLKTPALRITRASFDILDAIITACHRIVEWRLHRSHTPPSWASWFFRVDYMPDTFSKEAYNDDMQQCYQGVRSVSDGRAYSYRMPE